jgi:hypothetical protein
VSPILVRPVREQLEHDRIIRLLQAKSKRRYEAGINPGAEKNVAVGSGPTALYPDVVLASLERGHKLQAVIEVETGESVNHLEALAEWVHLSKLRVAFHLYVPSTMVEVARRLCEDNQIVANEIWSYHGVGDDVRFTLVHRVREQAPPPAPRRTPTVTPRVAAPRVAAPRTVAARKKPRAVAARPVRSGKAVKAAAKKPAKVQKRSR